MSIENVTMAFQNAATTGVGLTQFFSGLKNRRAVAAAHRRLHRLVRCGRRYHARGAVRLPLRINKTSDMANSSAQSYGLGSPTPVQR
jgi:hypothetical protein